MKQLILQALKTKFTGVQDAILDRVATKLAATVTTAEQVATAVEGVTFQQVLESYGDSRANQAQQTAVHNYEQKYGLKDGQKIDAGGGQQQQQQNVTTQQTTTTQPAGGGQPDATQQLLQQLLDQNKKLADRLDGIDRERTTANRKAQLSTLLEGLPENIKKAYSRTPVDSLSEEDFNSLKAEIQTEVGEISSSITQRGATFGAPSANQGGNQGTQLTEAQNAAISHREGAKPDAQPF